MSDTSTAREWAISLSNRIGEAVKLRRQELELSAQDVADRTVELGYPITRATISKVENGNRGGKVEVAELIILAQALETSPTSLLWHDMPDGEAWYLPTLQDTAGLAYSWWTGRGGVHLRDANTGVTPPIVMEHLRTSTLNELMETRAALQLARSDRDQGVAEAAAEISVLLNRVNELERRASMEGWTVKGHDNG